MAKKKDIKEQITAFKFEFDLLQKIPCSKEENKRYAQMCKHGQPLPENIFQYDNYGSDDLADFYTVYTPELTDAEIAEYLTYKKLSLLRTIKNCLVFFVALAVISLVFGLYAAMIG